ncbi:hypothetical protein NHX12_025678 [Muraenolepis orangiensis]|uniref:Uncharacterized protein n=1 Tax=Muraenolepis orangiensis TaxID=630683 RepID=A0A9Q0EDM3_9TELE|nr:hypothetical protein NHX12_025678 [Muraenolepis orangiensis]
MSMSLAQSAIIDVIGPEERDAEMRLLCIPSRPSLPSLSCVPRLWVGASRETRSVLGCWPSAPGPVGAESRSQGTPRVQSTLRPRGQNVGRAQGGDQEPYDEDDDQCSQYW